MVRLQYVFLTVYMGFERARSITVDLLSAAKETAALRCAKEPTQRVDCYPPRATFPDPTEELCLAQGCCWKSLDNEGIPCAFAVEEPPKTDKCDIVAKSSRLACRNPRFTVAKVLEDADSCHLAGCCFEAGECFQPMSDGYELLTLDETSNGWRGTLALRHGGRGPFGNDVPLLELNVVCESSNQVRIRITDPAFPRYEVPDLPVRRQGTQNIKGSNLKDSSDYEVHFTPWPFGIAVTRRGTNEVMFNSTPPIEIQDEGASFNGLVFENQFLEISTQLSTSKDHEPVLYGLGERLGPTRLRADKNGDLYSMFARAPNTTTPVHTRSGGDNLYGVHPFVLQLGGGQSSKAHGIFMLSSNAMEVVARQSALTYRLTGGILDFFVFSGSSPQQVIEQYTAIIGRPAMPPYWALGYHVGLGGKVDDAINAVAQLRMAGVPMDAYWQDFNYLSDTGRAFSLDENKFPHSILRAFIDDLHFHSQYFLCVQVPAITLHNTSSNMQSTSGKMAKYYALTKDNTSPFPQTFFDLRHESSMEDSAVGGDGSREKEQDVSGHDEESHSKISGQDSRSDSDDYSAGERSEAGSQRAHSEEDDGLDWDPVVRGEELDVFVKGVNGERYAQKAFRSGWAVFVDFFHPRSLQYWHEQLANFYKYVMPFDGLWLDMNEPSSSCDCTLAAEDDMCTRICIERHLTVASRQDEKGEPEQFTVPDDGGFIRTSDVNFPFDPYRQPFVPGQNEVNSGGHGNLNSATLPMAALHYSSLHYNLHSLYGHAQARATRMALDAIVKKRSVLLSRATFSGTGQYAGHWLSDSGEASWDQLRLSISGTLKMNLLGIPLSGPNVCGSRGKSSTELCVRWHQAASLLPLLRNHAISGESKQTPVDYDAEALNILRSTLLQRYRFLPYMYTLFYEAHRSGNPVVRPLSFEFPSDKNARDIEHQYLVGSALMVSPVVHEGAISVEVYFPNACWFDAQSGKLALDPAIKNNQRVSLLTPLSKLQVHLRGGTIVPTQQSLTTTALSRREGFTLLAALTLSQDNSSAFGELYVDDGDSLSAIEDQRYSLMHFTVHQNSKDSVEFKSTVNIHGYDGPEMHADLKEIRLFGVRGDGFAANSSMDVTLVSKQGATSQSSIKADFFAQSEMLVLSRFDLTIGQEFQVKVVAQPAATPEGGQEEAGSKSVGANASGNSESGEESGKGEGKKSIKKSKFSITSIVGIVAGCVFLAIILILLFRRRHRGYETI
ncbi:maltase-intestinal-like [Plasmopara halstedii]|uniref:Maltase n=1 Tax=Plasmopara halstedii TaxID=4781 RepID=A0A0P1A4S7_PLAHL|nr:maltase-intestinal-like [Plasmopara halstedii]CEG35529.1 maltase-intestinal-like [Plasmopara halstedii]|eukprot:XP_024571898.1 maltase-intestinal-like [Plasmopara halstedii]